MARPGFPLRALALLAMIALLSGCDLPTHNPWKLRAIRIEAQSLMAKYPAVPLNDWVHVPKSEWPPVIASLRPKAVIISRGAVDIATTPSFDGGWGYAVVRSKQDLPMPEQCYSALGEGVFWHGPC